MTSIFHGGESIPKALRRQLYVACDVLFVLGCNSPSREIKIQCVNKVCKKDGKKEGKEGRKHEDLFLPGQIQDNRNHATP